MANPPKKKGTAGETELLRLLAGYGITVQRRAASARHDLFREGLGAPVEVLATRPDRGEWLLSIRLDDFAELIREADDTWAPPLHIEVKRFKSFAHHRIFTSKFGRKRGAS